MPLCVLTGSDGGGGVNLHRRRRHYSGLHLLHRSCIAGPLGLAPPTVEVKENGEEEGRTTRPCSGTRSPLRTARAGRKPPFWDVKRPARPYKIATQTRFTVGNAEAAETPPRGPDGVRFELGHRDRLLLWEPSVHTDHLWAYTLELWCLHG